MKKHKESYAKHTFAGEAEGLPLVEWLNSKEGRPRADIAEALVIFWQCQEATEQTGKATMFDALVADQSITEKIQHVQFLLSQYTFRPSLRPGPEGVGFRWLPAWEEPERFIMDLTLKRYGPTNAILGIMRLAEKGLLSQVKQCRCGRWVFARSKREPFCSRRCYLKAYRAQPGWQEYRREWRVRNRNAHKVLDKNEGTMKKGRVR